MKIYRGHDNWNVGGFEHFPSKKSLLKYARQNYSKSQRKEYCSNIDVLIIKNKKDMIHYLNVAVQTN